MASELSSKIAASRREALVCELFLLMFDIFGPSWVTALLLESRFVTVDLQLVGSFAVDVVMSSVRRCLKLREVIPVALYCR